MTGQHKIRQRPLIPPEFTWQIAIFTGPTPLTLGPPSPTPNPILTASEIRDIEAEIVADPFMMRRDGRWHLFCEVMPLATGVGEIGHASSDDGYRWTYHHTVLREPFHLSYPYVFEWQGEVYMTPETLEPGAVRLYRARNFPSEWELAGDLIDAELADPSPVEFQGRWWLFACPTWRTSDSLRLYHADSPLGVWTEHPRSPLRVDDCRRSRPAGRLIPWEGSLLRFAQDCHPDYGTRVRAFQITRLTTTEYAEHEVKESPILAEGLEDWCALGMHHVDPHRLADGSWIACVDGRCLYREQPPIKAGWVAKLK